MSRKYVLAAGAAALGAAAMGRGQRSRRIWLGMQGLPAQGRRAGDAVSARELVLYAVNDGGLYPMRENIEANLRKKVAKGQFDPAKAPQAYSRWLETAAKQYNERHGSPGVPWHRVFDAPTRQLAAQEMVNDFIAEEGVQGRGGRRAKTKSHLFLDVTAGKLPGDLLETRNVSDSTLRRWEARGWISDRGERRLAYLVLTQAGYGAR
jgi:hypothetical protein